ncbi:MAG: acetate--CoA ligase family protein [Candidatus Hadarchaeota archaeon]
MAVDKVAEILKSVEEGRKELTETESKSVLQARGIPVNRTMLAADVPEAIRIAREIHYPVVLKLASPDILHKSDAKGVKLGVGSEFELKRAFEELMNNAKLYKPNARILGVTVQEYIPPAREVIVGGIQDRTFGPTVMFGLGGIWVEVLKDVSFRLAPLDPAEARGMIQEVKGSQVLAGIRGAPPADINAIADVIQKVGQLIVDFPNISEIDINPMFVFDAGKGAVAVDARILLGGS